MSHRRITQPIVALIVALSPAVAVADEFREFRANMARYESDGGQNIPNFRYTGPGGKHTAGGVCQMTNTTWRRIAPLIDIDITKFDVAGAASEFDQWRVCWKLWSLEGYKPWTCDGCNPKLRKALAAATGDQRHDSQPVIPPEAVVTVTPRAHDWDVFPDHDAERQPSQAPAPDAAPPQTDQDVVEKSEEEQPR
jgi:hypothetical protein